MKKLFILSFIFTLNILTAQEADQPASTAKIHYGIFGGINFETASETGGSFLIEANTGISNVFNLNFSAGYSRSFTKISYNVKTYRTGTIGGAQYFYAEEYDVNKKEFNIFPLTIGLQYEYTKEVLSPYLFFGLCYNFIVDTKYYRTPGVNRQYDSFENIPVEYRNARSVESPDNSYGFSIGVGGKYRLTQKLNLDIRYYYKYDNEIMNTHQLLIGLVL